MKHISIKIKKTYVDRYINGEDAKLLSEDIARKYDTIQKSPQNLIFQWKRQYSDGKFENGYVRNKRGRGVSKLPSIDFINYYSDNFSKEEILYLWKKYSHPEKYLKNERFNFIYKETSMPKSRLFLYFKVSKGGYVNWKIEKKIGSKYNDILLKDIQKIYKESYGIYGAGKIRYILKDEYNLKRNIKTIQRYMKYLGIRSIYAKKKANRNIGTHSHNKIPNLINGNFIASYPLKNIFSDTTEFMFNRKKYIACFILDSFNNEVISHKVGFKKDFNLVEQTLLSIKGQNTILHTDNGSEFINKQSLEFFRKNGIIISTSQPGKPLQNRPSEFCFRHFKTEWCKNENIIESKYIDAENYVDSFVEFYNEIRIQSNLNFMSPIDFKIKFK